MPRLESELPESQLDPVETNEAIRRLKQEITGGKHWYLALLEAIERWDVTEETINERTYKYLISGEAFDWLLLAERLCQAVDGFLPDAEKTALLFHGIPPLDLNTEEFRELIGINKYHQHLNYYYGITVEEALIIAVEEEVRKERRSSGLYRDKDTTNEAYRRIYGSTKAIMLRRFRKEKRYSQLKSIKLNELKEFTYWLFKHRLKQCDKAKVASDTKKALDWLKRKGISRRLNNHESELETVDILPSGSQY